MIFKTIAKDVLQKVGLVESEEFKVQMQVLAQVEARVAVCEQKMAELLSGCD